jgi:hypothetical protein
VLGVAMVVAVAEGRLGQEVGGGVTSRVRQCQCLQHTTVLLATIYVLAVCMSGGCLIRNCAYTTPIVLDSTARPNITRPQQASVWQYWSSFWQLTWDAGNGRVPAQPPCR